MPHFTLDTVLGREVWTIDGRRFGHLEECRVEHDGDGWVVREWVIGSAGLFERLGLDALLVAGISPGSGHIASWEQLDVTNPARLKLTCPVEDLRKDLG